MPGGGRLHWNMELKPGGAAGEGVKSGFALTYMTVTSIHAGQTKKCSLSSIFKALISVQYLILSY